MQSEQEQQQSERGNAISENYKQSEQEQQQSEKMNCHYILTLYDTRTRTTAV